MTRNQIHARIPLDPDDPDDWGDPADRCEPGERQRRRTGRRRLAVEGLSGRLVVDEPEPTIADAPTRSPSTYDQATKGPLPAPKWLVTDLGAFDTPLGGLKSGKEADVHLIERGVPGEPSTLLAVKAYRTGVRRTFTRDAAYTEGRRIRRSRETRAMAARTAFGRDLLAGQWAVAEFAALGRLWSQGVRVPYPVQLLGSEVMMEFVGEPDGTAAPRLAGYRPVGDPVEELTVLWRDLVANLEIVAELGLVHGDLSAYNVLVHRGRCVLIDLPQVLDLVANPRGQAFLARDAETIAAFFRRRGVAEADGPALARRLALDAGVA